MIGVGSSLKFIHGPNDTRFISATSGVEATSLKII
jgi:hypothetical protein